jgi:ABC-type Fe3+ transport system permease subunit
VRVNIATPSTLLLAAAVDSPAIYSAAIGQMDPSTALFRYLIAILVCGLMLAFLRMVTRTYQEERVRAEEDAAAAAAAQERAERAERENAEAEAEAGAGESAYDGQDRRRRTPA